MRGRIVVMAGRESRPKFPVGPFYAKDGKLFGFAMFNAPAEEQRKCAAEINRWLAKGKLRPRIGRVMKLSEAAAAHQLQEENATPQGRHAVGQDRAGAIEADGAITFPHSAREYPGYARRGRLLGYASDSPSRNRAGALSTRTRRRRPRWSRGRPCRPRPFARRRGC